MNNELLNILGEPDWHIIPYDARYEDYVSYDKKYIIMEYLNERKLFNCIGLFLFLYGVH